MTQPVMSATPLEQEYQDLLAKLPSRAPIYLPTEKIPLEDKIRGVRHVIQIYKQDLDAVYRPRLRALREQYKGRKRCFLIGNGPSLNETDLAVLKDEVTFAVNGFFLKAADLEWKPTFYVVEDHLVAEDRAAWINEFKGPIKLFPAYLGYMFEASEDTIFYNHRPRKSYPHGFDFSMEADKITYTGCTVTFSMMQLAAYLGFEEIYLIGVDASYAIPEDAKESKDYGVGVLDMKSDDPNHFDPNYFGKGFRWHDPQVDKMIEAYAEARRTLEGTGQMIYNAGIGGQLEVFERRSFHSLFPNARPPEVVLAQGHARVYPRLLLLDMTPFANGTATGEIKSNLFAGWPADRLLQVARHGKDGFALSRPDADKGFATKPCSEQAAREAALGFQADVVLYRPVPDVPWLHSLAMSLLQEIGKPVVAWVMDDWPRDLAERDPEQWRALGPDLLSLLKHAHTRLSICDSMSSAFEARYGASFLALANGVRVSDWPERPAHSGRRLRIRYAGGLAANMQRASLLRVARAVERLGKSGHAISLEINSQPWWMREAKDDFASFEFTSVTDETRPLDVYRGWLRRADAVVIAYNFDDETLRYVRYSMANKMPECLASGAVLLAHGPADAATIGYLKEHGLGLVVDQEDEAALEKSLLDLLNDPERRQALGEAARAFVFENHNLDILHERLRQIVVDAAQSDTGGIPLAVRQDEPPVIAAPPEPAASPAPRDAVVTAFQPKAAAPQPQPLKAPEPAPAPSASEAPSRPAAQAALSGITPPKPPLSRPWYAPAGDAMRQFTPGLFPMLRQARRALWTSGGSVLIAAGGVVALGALLFAAFGPGLPGTRLVLAGAVLGFGVVLGVGALGWRLRKAVRTLSAENRQLAEEIARIHDLAAGRERRVERLLSDQIDFEDRLSQVKGLQARGAHALEEQLAALKDEHSRTLVALKAEISRSSASARSGAEAALREQMSHLEGNQARITQMLRSEIAKAGAAARSGAEEALRAELAQLDDRQAQLADALKQEIADAGAAARSGAEDALRAELAQLEDRQAQLADALKQEIADAGAAARSGAEDVLRAELARLEAEQARTAQSLRDEISQASETTREGVEAGLRAELARLESELARASYTLKGEITRAAESARTGAQADLRSELAKLEAQQARAAERLNDEIARVSEAAQSGAEAQLRPELQRLEAEQARVTNVLKGEIAEISRKALSGGEATLRAEIAALEARLEAGQSSKAAALKDELKQLQDALEQKLIARAANAAASFSQAAQLARQRELELKARIDEIGEKALAGGDAALKAEIEALETRMRESHAANAAALKDELKRLQEALEQKLLARAASTAASFGQASQLARQREAELREQIAALHQALKKTEEEALTAQTLARAGDETLHEELRAVRQGLEQRLRAEVDEATSESFGRLTERLEAVALTAGEADAGLRQELEALKAALEQKLEARTGAAMASLDRVSQGSRQREAELQAQIAALQQALKRTEEIASAAQSSAREGGDTLREELKAVREGSAEMGATLQASLKNVSTRLSTAEAHSVSLHVTSALRAMRPLWTGGSAVQALKEQAEVEHGHELLMAVLADEEKASPGKLSGKTLIEIGTTRENVPAQASTQKLGVFSALTGLRFITVDMDPANTTAARSILRYINPGAQALTHKGETYLRQHPAPLEYVYLDAFDFDHGKHSDERQASYRKYLGTDINDVACWKMHEDCADTIIARMVKGGIVVLDDTWTDEEGRYAGKGKLAAPLLLENGFRLIARTRKTLALRRGDG
jgi:glycosyltransferase involved in cell wall biosynthesis